MATFEKTKVELLKVDNKELKEEQKFKDEFVSMMAHEK